MLRTTTVLALAAAAVLMGPVLAQTSAAAKLQAERQQPYGEYLVDADGRALYMFEKDPKGESTCYDACAAVWPPMLTSGKPQTEQAVKDALVGTVERKGGQTQVTYNGMPLYYYAKDQGSGTATGQDVHDQFGEWYLVSPAGQKIEKEKKS
ncbi:COG4315 family predicted lipoprotein [Microvirga splendida]|uniref:Lipoprotein with Yx(FWY)xxD motif n=1 Tax=Microvirga splendida TaxID=2795727 RepID=A0ABS0Y442_9HYPH|nr:hypothetical protein [Microvirga splendida]MBJ6127075.1 hypothetical protein [Microvirga splendida]